jgi:hypothetical protein
VIRLKRAIRILNDVLCWPPNFLNLGDGTMEGMRKVDLGDAMIAFWQNPKNNNRWEFWMSGMILAGTHALLGLGAGAAKDRAIKGITPKNDPEWEILSMKQFKVVRARENVNTYVERSGKCYKLLINSLDLNDKLPDDFQDKGIAKFEEVLGIINKDDLESKIGDIVCFDRGETRWYKMVKTVKDMAISAILSAKTSFLKDMCVAAYSDLPFIYQVTDMLFKPYYPSKSLELTSRKFAVYAIIVEAMVNERKLGYEIDSMYLGRNVVKIFGEDGDVYNCVTKYLSRLNITAQEISDAVEILDREEVSIKYKGRGSGKGETLLFATNKKPLGSWRVGNNVFIHKNDYGSFWVDGDGPMYDYDKPEEDWRKDRVWYEAKGLVVRGGVIKIGDGAFKDCRDLESVTIEEGVVNIGWEAFAGCINLKSITIPSTVTVIGDKAFAGCTMLKTIVCKGEPMILSGGSFPKTDIKLYVSSNRLYDKHKEYYWWKKLRVAVQGVCEDGTLVIGRTIVDQYKWYATQENNPWYNFNIKERFGT